MPVSEKGIDLLIAREGERFHAYQDSVGVWTIGVGHTGRMYGNLVKAGDVITKEQSRAFLDADLEPVEKAIDSLGVSLLPNEYDALASFAFNIGVNGFLHSSVVRCLLASKTKANAQYNRDFWFAEAAKDFLMWEKPASLKSRRESEQRQFLTPYASTVAPATATKEASTVAETPKKESTMFNITTGLAGSLLHMIFTYGPKVATLAAHGISNSADVKAKGADMIARLKTFDVPGATVDFNAILADFGLDQEALHSVTTAARTTNAPASDPIGDLVTSATKTLGL